MHNSLLPLLATSAAAIKGKFAGLEAKLRVE
jgi:hypothetical protein